MSKFKLNYLWKMRGYRQFLKCADYAKIYILTW